MKKSLLVLGALAMLSVAFVGCKGNGDTTGDDTSDPAITDSAKPYEIPADAVEIVNFTTVEAIPSELELPTWGYEGSLAKDATYGQVLNLKCKEAGSYPTMTYNFKEAVDLSTKTLVVVMKGDLSDIATNDTLKFVVASAAKENSETNQMAPKDGTKYVAYEGAVKDFWAGWDNDANAAGTPATLTAITSVTTAFQKADKDIQIAAIYYK